MAIKKYHRNIDQPDYVSRSQIKQEAQAIKMLAARLVELPDAKLVKLPLSEISLKSLQDFKKMTSHLAKKRHLMYVAKCLRKDDYSDILSHLEDEKVKQKKSLKENDSQANENLVAEALQGLVESSDSAIESLILDYPSIERQKLRQLLRNLNKAKTESKKQNCQNKLVNYLGEHIGN